MRTHAHRRFPRFLAIASALAALTLAACGGTSSQPPPPPIRPGIGASGVVSNIVLPTQAIQTKTVNLGSSVLQAILRQPASGTSHVAILVAHPSSPYSSFSVCSDFAARGYTTLCEDTLYSYNQFGYYGYEQDAPGIAAGITYLRGISGISTVLLFGHSMGGPMMAFYENVAENGPAACSGPEKIMPCVTTGLTGLPKADGVILFDAHLGDALATFTYMDPAVTNNALGNRNAAVDMFDPANGYNPAPSGSQYSPTFIQTYLAAQAARNAQVLSQAQALLAQERASTRNPNATGDDIPFTVVGSNGARLWQADIGLVNCTQQAHVLLSHDNTRPTQTVCSVRPSSGSASAAASSATTISANVHVWLGAHALRSLASPAYNQTQNDLTGVDYASSATSTVANIGGLTKPLLIVTNGGHYFLRPDEIVYNTAQMADKTYAIEQGSVHAGTECTACEQLYGLPTPANATTFGYYGDTLTRTEVYMTQWIYQRWGV